MSEHNLMLNLTYDRGAHKGRPCLKMMCMCHTALAAATTADLPNICIDITVRKLTALYGWGATPLS